MKKTKMKRGFCSYLIGRLFFLVLVAMTVQGYSQDSIQTKAGVPYQGPKGHPSPTQFLVIDPTLAFPDTDALAVEALSESGRSVWLMGSGAGSPLTGIKNQEKVFTIDFDGTNLNQFEDALQIMKKNGARNVILHFTGHGGPSEIPGENREIWEKMGSTSVKFQEGLLRWNTLARVLGNYNQDMKFKIVTETCYGGGAHLLSRSMDNICSAAVSPYFKGNCSLSGRPTFFSEGFYDHIKKNPRTSFAMAALSGMADDVLNWNQGNLSSFDFVDAIMKKGQHEKDYSSLYGPIREGRPISYEENLLPDDYQPTVPDVGDLFVSEPHVPHDLKDVLELMGNPEFVPVLGLVRQSCQPVSSFLDGDSFERAQKVLDSLLDLKLKTRFSAGTMFINALKNLKDKKDIYEANLGQYQKEFKNFLTSYEEYKKAKEELEKQQNVSVLSSLFNIFGMGSTRNVSKDNSEMRKKVELFEMEMRGFSQKIPPESMEEKVANRLQAFRKATLKDPTFKEYLFNRNLANVLVNLEEFSRVAKPGHKKKFLQLWSCEWEETL